MVIGCIISNTALSSWKEKFNDRQGIKVHETMDKILCKDTEINKNEEDDETSIKEYVENIKGNNEMLAASSTSNWWPNDNEEEKHESRQRWSFGSDISIEAVESIQTRLCCSPVDEFDSTISSESEELIINGTDEIDDSYKSYIQVSPACSPTFKDVMCDSNSEKQNENHDADTADDELIDYSKRYTTDSSMLADNKPINSSHIRQRPRRNIVINTVARHVPEKKISVNNRSKVDPFGDYAETDLDQPTDYSLRYAEEDTDEDEKENPQFFCTNEQEDTIQTYHTEGTPYQTPCNFSTATSMSDLLSLEDNRDEAVYKRQYLREEKQNRIEKSEKTERKDYKNRTRRRYVSEDSKIPILEEVREINDRKTPERKIEKLVTPPQSPAEPCDKEKEIKVVSFNLEDSYAQETPLMFSRSSSLDSLSEFEQHSIHDDRSSVISDFSHRTSGAVSPSDLPDSPTQTVPPSPNRLKQQNFHSHLQQNSQRAPLRTPPRKPPSVQQPSHHQQIDNKIQLVESLPRNHDRPYPKVNIIPEHHNSVFEDGLVSFKEESMPSKVYSSAASTLSALTIDDEDGEECDSHEIINKIAAIRVRTSAAGMHQAPTPRHYRIDSCNDSDKSSLQQQQNKVLNRHSGYRNDCLPILPTKEQVHYIINEEENDYVNSYSNKEIQNNRYRDSLKDSWYHEEHLKNDNRYNSNRSSSRSPVAKQRNNKIISSQKPELEEAVTMDTLRIYCTEDTPTYISPYGSQSNLSALSILSSSDDNLGCNGQFGDELPSFYFENSRTGSRADDYNSNASSDFSEDDEDGSFTTRKRIDVSPFDSQINLANFSLLCIEEENEDEDIEDEEEVKRKVNSEEEDESIEKEINDETDNSARDDSYTEDTNAYNRLSYENSDCSDDDRKVLEECIKAGVTKLIRKTNNFDVDE